MYWIRCFIIFSLFLVSSQIYATDQTLLVLDVRNSSLLPKHFRTTSDNLLTANNLNTRGFVKLHAAASGEFSKSMLKKIINIIETKQITVVDLRQESHGFLNEHAISWYGPHNAANAHLFPEQIEQRQGRLLGNLEELNYVTTYQILKKTSAGIILKYKPIDFWIHQIQSEADLVAENQLKYARFYVQDYHRPKNDQVDRFIKLVKELSDKDWIYFHCRAGAGRSTTFMVMFDMLHNAKKVSFDDILDRQVAIGGKDLRYLVKPTHYKYKFELHRLEFIKRFYEYTRTNQDNFKTSWSDWDKLHPKAA